MLFEVVLPIYASSNSGIEGETGDGGVLRLREKQMRNFMVALLASQGTPMVLAGALLLPACCAKSECSRLLPC